ncbi:methyltransferase [Zea mays]|uniref:Methyltransferase n=1 Tax=Zea mays TaxID=4577 RepID=A0A1D6PG39_MAIZE|nr:methyltransferase [Zea mays]
MAAHKGESRVADRKVPVQRPEVESLAELFAGPGVSESVEWRMPQNHHVDSPFHLVRLPGDERLSAHVANRRDLRALGPWHHLRGAREVGQEYPNKRKLPFRALESSFKIVIDNFSKGRVNFKKPDHMFFFMETDDYG